MNRFFLLSLLCLSLSACETIKNPQWPTWSSLNPFNETGKAVVSDKETVASAAPQNNGNASDTELAEMQQLDVINVPTPKAEPVILSEETTYIDPIEETITINESFEKPVAAEVETKVKTETAVKETPENRIAMPAASGCPSINMMPAAKSITYFEDNMSGQMTARASITEIRGGCEVVDGGMEIDLDILMRGTITNKGRFEGNVNEEAFMTFPYFVSILNPDGQTVNKEILATAMRFRPAVDYLDHAEKITQFVPMDDVSQSQNYEIIVGFQLTRKQLEYNRLEITARPDNKRVSPDTSTPRKRSVNPLAE